MDDYRVALVKQDVYQDLYVCSPQVKNPTEILLSSTTRVGPIGLFTLLDTDFHIVTEETASECQMYRQVTPHLADSLHNLKSATLDKLPGHEFFRPGSSNHHGDFSVAYSEVAWDLYDIVISINVSIPTQLARQFPNTLFCYMIGEANLATKRVRFGYDVCLNQETKGRVARKPGVVDFPYTFVGSSCLQKLLAEHLGRESRDAGIFAEINSCLERPVINTPPSFRVFEKLGHAIRLHQQRISDNMREVYDARYFVKLGGRHIRGNSIIEAISLGTLVLANPTDVTHRELLPPESWIRSGEEARDRIRYLDKHRHAYQQLLTAHRDRLQRYVTEAPLESLRNCLAYKRNKLARHRAGWNLRVPWRKKNSSLIRREKDRRPKNKSRNSMGQRY